MVMFYTAVDKRCYLVSFGKEFHKNKVVDICIKLVFTGGVCLYAEVSKELSDYLKNNKSAWGDFAQSILNRTDLAFNNHKMDLIEFIWN